jgi:sarcosine oxidase subunit beta
VTRTADVVVIGGGVVGVSVAWHLARLGVKRVVVLERADLLGTGATGASAGGTRKLFSLDINVRLALEGQAAFRRLEDELGYALDFRKTGYLFLALGEGELAGYRETLATLARLGAGDARLVTAAEVRSIVPQLAMEGVLGGLFSPSDGHLSPAALTEAFAREARRHGAEIVTGAEVVAIERAGDRVRAVRTARERIETDVVVNAAGAHAAEVARRAGVEIPVVPRRRLCFVTRDDRGLAPGIPMVFDFQTWFYFRREGKGVLFGTANTADPPTLDPAPDWDFLARISPLIFRRLPCLADAEVATAWAGCEGYTPDGNPLIGPSRELRGLVLACGFSGHGVMHSPATGRIVADQILGRDVGYDLGPFAPDRFSAAAPVRTREPIMGHPYGVELPEA